MAPYTSEKSPQRFYSITSPRSASNLLMQILNLDEQKHVITGVHGGYYFVDKIWCPARKDCAGRPIEEWTEEQRRMMREAIDKSYKKLITDIFRLGSGEEGKTVLFVKEHSSFLADPVAEGGWMSSTTTTSSSSTFTTAPFMVGAGSKSPLNETLMSDEFLLSFMPSFIIRHPALMIASNFRTFLDLRKQEDPDYEVHKDAEALMECNWHWSRQLFDFYNQNIVRPSDSKEGECLEWGAVNWPIVLEADDIMLRPDVVRRYAKLCRLDEQKLRFSWDSAPEEVIKNHSRIMIRMRDTILASTGVMKSKTSEGIDIDAETIKWKMEFGEASSTKLEELVRAAMPDYEYLKAKRLRAEPMVVDRRHV